MIRLDVIKRMTKRSLNFKNLLNLSNLASMASRERKRVMKKRGKKLIKYREVTKWVTWSNLQKRKSPPIGRTKTSRRKRALVLYFEKTGNRRKRMTETIMRGAWGTQSCSTPYRMYQREPGLSV
jgi:hypothetical protein